MASTVLKIIPTNPSFVPVAEKQVKARNLLEGVYKTSQLDFTTTEAIEFIDQGENFESVSCNVCGRTIDIEYWQNAMDKSYSSKFEDLSMITPCCNQPTSLNDLVYKSAAGFSKFVISIEDPESKMEEGALAQLEQILDIKLRLIYAHYC